jgi:hypothetical protein
VTSQSSSGPRIQVGCEEGIRARVSELVSLTEEQEPYMSGLACAGSVREKERIVDRRGADCL